MYGKEKKQKPQKKYKLNSEERRKVVPVESVIRIVERGVGFCLQATDSPSARLLSSLKE